MDIKTEHFPITIFPAGGVKRSAIILMFFLFIFVNIKVKATAGVNPFSEFVGKPYGTYHYALRDTLRKRYDSNNRQFVMKTIEQMRSLPDPLHDKQWQLEASFMEACYKHDYLNGDSLSFVNEMERLAKASQNVGNQVFYVRIVRRLFDFYRAYDLTDGISAARRLEKVLHTVTSQQYPDVVDCQFRLGEYYYFFKDYERAEKYFLSTVHHRYEPAVYAIFIHARNNLGAIYQKYYHNLDASDRWIRSMATFRHEHHITEMANIYDAWMIGDLGYNQMLRDNYATAIKMMKTSLKTMYNEAKDYSYSYNTAVNIASSYCHLGMFNEAKPYLEIATVCWKNKDNIILFDRQSFFQAMSQYYIGTGNAKLGMCYQDSAFIARDKRDAHYNMNAFLMIEQQMNKVEYQQKEKENKDNYDRYILMLIVAIIIAIAFASSQILYIQKRRAYHALVKKSQQWASVPLNAAVENDEEESNDNDDKPQNDNAPAVNEVLMSSEQSSSLIERIRKYVEQSRCFLNPEISLNDISRAVYSNRSYVSQAINANYPNFSTFINEYRIQEAVRILSQDENAQLNEIMLDVGFKSRKTFYNAFKLFTGLSPITFKKNLER